jgi:hypothetical protein
MSDLELAQCAVATAVNSILVGTDHLDIAVCFRALPAPCSRSFRHTGGLQARPHEARRLIELTVIYGEQFKRVGRTRLGGA